MEEKIMLGCLVGEGIDEFEFFEMTEIQKVIVELSSIDPIDIAHAEYLQQRALYGASILSDYIGKLVKSALILESKINTTKNKVSLNYKAPNGEKTTMDMKKQAGESSEEVENLSIQLAKVKGAKSNIERKYEILLKAHHHFKEVSLGQKKTIPGYTNKSSNWE